MTVAADPGISCQASVIIYPRIDLQRFGTPSVHDGPIYMTVGIVLHNFFDAPFILSGFRKPTLNLFLSAGPHKAGEVSDIAINSLWKPKFSEVTNSAEFLGHGRDVQSQIPDDNCKVEIRLKDAAAFANLRSTVERMIMMKDGTWPDTCQCGQLLTQVYDYPHEEMFLGNQKPRKDLDRVCLNCAGFFFGLYAEVSKEVKSGFASLRGSPDYKARLDQLVKFVTVLVMVSREVLHDPLAIAAADILFGEFAFRTVDDQRIGIANQFLESGTIAFLQLYDAYQEEVFGYKMRELYEQAIALKGKIAQRMSPEISRAGTILNSCVGELDQIRALLRAGEMKKAQKAYESIENVEIPPEIVFLGQQHVSACRQFYYARTFVRLHLAIYRKDKKQVSSLLENLEAWYRGRWTKNPDEAAIYDAAKAMSGGVQ